MTNYKIRSDKHGLYVKADGQVFRPVSTKNSYPHPKTVESSQFVELTDVELIYVKRTPFCKVIDRDYNEEWWHSHGKYVDLVRPEKKSYECWTPSQVEAQV
jgi:hypothetical protein